MPAMKPLPSRARVEANRANAQRSTGPTTAEGKARSRGNAVRHGLTGAGIALPTEDQARVLERFAAIRDQLAPATPLGAHFVGKIALLTVRSERAALHEAAALAFRIRHAPEEFDRQRREDAEALIERLDANPPVTYRNLLRTPEGVDALADRLLELRATLNRPTPLWSAELEVHYEACHGRWPGDREATRGLALSRALLGDFRQLDAAERPAEGVRPPIGAWVRALIAEIDAEVDRLGAYWTTLDHDRIALDRAEAGHRALFDPGRDATLARRYDAASTRDLYRALDAYAAAEAEAEVSHHPFAPEPPPPAPEPAPTPPAPEPAPTPAEASIEDPATVAVNSNLVNNLTSPLGSFGAGPIAAGPGSPMPAGWAGDDAHPGRHPVPDGRRG